MSMLALGAGPLFIAATFALMALRVEPFANFFYLFAWYGLIFTFDQLIRRREGRSDIASCGPGFVVLLIWSAAGWYFFEVTNLRLQNWHYVFVVDHPLARPLGTFFSFATVFPGIFLIDRYLRLRGVGAGWRGRPLDFSAASRRRLQLGGVLFLALPMIWPTYFFPLVWGAVFMILAPLDYRTDGQGLLNQLERGEYGSLGRTLLAGLIAGFFWESLNFWARAKWIYTVPFFDRLKLFEMPLAGFLGFPPFAVECVVAYRFLVWQRVAPPFGDMTSQRAVLRPLPVRIALWAGVLAFCIAVDHWVVRPVIITSVTPLVADTAGLHPSTRAGLERSGVHYLTDLEGPLARRQWDGIRGQLSAHELSEVERVAALYLHQGIGTAYGNLLVAVGVNSLAGLAGEDPEALHARLGAVANGGRVPTLRQVRVWVRRAHRAAPGG
jgi:hypothetical protein